MDKKGFSDLEDQIKTTIKNASDYIDFAQRKKEIYGKLENNLDEVITKSKSKIQKINDKIDSARQNKDGKFSTMTKKNINQTQMYITKRPAGSISGRLYIVFGFASTGITSIALINYLILFFTIGGISAIKLIGLGLLSSLFIGSIILSLVGVNLRGRVKRFKMYVKALNYNCYSSIEKLAISTGSQPKFVVKDLKKMIKLGMFPQAKFDDKETYFMLNNEVYVEYLKLQETLKKRNKEEIKKKREYEEYQNDPEKKELRETIEYGKNYIKQIKSANDSIHEKEISEKLYRLENIVSKIFSYIKNNPKKLSDVHKLTNHYLPITLKLVNTYKELSNQPIQGDNIMSAKNEIEKTMDIINSAFEKLLDDLFGEVALDISTDISVIETLFMQEGLTKNDFKK